MKKIDIDILKDVVIANVVTISIKTHRIWTYVINDEVIHKIEKIDTSEMIYETGKLKDAINKLNEILNL